jgi:hypothetical protein
MLRVLRGTELYTGLWSVHPKGKTPLGRLRLNMKGNIDMDLNTSGWEGMDGKHAGHRRCRSGCCEHDDELLGYVNFGNV